MNQEILAALEVLLKKLDVLIEKNEKISIENTQIKKEILEVKSEMNNSVNTIQNIFSNLTKILEEKFHFAEKIQKEVNEQSCLIEKINKEILKLNNQKYSIHKILRNEIKIIDHSDYCEGYEGEFLFDDNYQENKDNNPFCLFGGNTNEFLCLDLGKKYYIEKLLLSVNDSTVTYYDCTPKNIKVSIKNNEDNWVEMASFICDKVKESVDYQIFELNFEAQFVKIEFIDVWGDEGGKSMLICKLGFKVLGEYF